MWLVQAAMQVELIAVCPLANVYYTCAFQIGPSQIGPFQIGPFQLGPFQIGPFQIGPCQLGPFQIDPFQIAQPSGVIFKPL